MLPLTLTATKSVAVSGLLDTGATVNVLPYVTGVELGFDWNRQMTKVRLGGNLALVEARAIAVTAVVGNFTPVRLAVSGLVQLLNAAVYSYFYTGITRFSLKVARGVPYAFTDLFDVGTDFVAVMIANVLSGIAIALGTVFLIVPGVIAAIGLSFAVPLIVDRKLGAIEALTASWQLTNGHKLNISMLWAICLVITVAGACPCGLGLLIAVPLVTVAASYVYLRLTGQPVAEPARAY